MKNDPIDDEIDKVIDEKSSLGKNERTLKVFDNIMFRDRVRKNPLMMKHYAKGLTVEYIDLGPFLNMRLWTRSIYTTDKLLRLGSSAIFEMQKKYLPKKRKAGFDFFWLILIIIAVIMVVLVLVMLLPKIMGGG